MSPNGPTEAYQRKGPPNAPNESQRISGRGPTTRPAPRYTIASRITNAARPGLATRPPTLVVSGTNKNRPPPEGSDRSAAGLHARRSNIRSITRCAPGRRTHAPRRTPRSTPPRPHNRAHRMSRPRFRTRPERDFTTLRNGMLRDPGLSLKAKGLLGVMMSYPPGWIFYQAHLVTLSTDGRDAVKSGVDELVAAGYVTKERERNEDGTLGAMIYNVSDERHAHPEGESTYNGFSSAGKTSAGKPAAIKKDSKKTKEKKKEKHVSEKSENQQLEPEPAPPPQVDPALWERFRKHRRELRRPLTAEAVRLIARRLAEHPHDANEMLENSIANGWTGVFPLRRNGKGASSPEEAAARDAIDLYHYLTSDGGDAPG